MSELKPCPFCGGKATFDLILAGCRPQCLVCGLHLMLGDVGVGWYATEDEAAEDWNRRAIPADQVLVPRELLERILANLETAYIPWEETKELRPLLHP